MLWTFCNVVERNVKTAQETILDRLLNVGSLCVFKA